MAIDLEPGVDRTVRPHWSDFTPDAFVGRDYSTYQGTVSLLAQIREYRERKGLPCNLRVVHAGYHKGETLYGIREHKPEPPKTPPTVAVAVAVKREPRRISDVNATKAAAICAPIVARYPSVSFARILTGGRDSETSHARHECMRAVWAAELTKNYSSLGRFFKVSPSTVHRSLGLKPIGGRRGNWLKDAMRVAA